jgi:hypothetical protein
LNKDCVSADLRFQSSLRGTLSLPDTWAYAGIDSGFTVTARWLLARQFMVRGFTNI